MSERPIFPCNRWGYLVRHNSKPGGPPPNLVTFQRVLIVAWQLVEALPGCGWLTPILGCGMDVSLSSEPQRSDEGLSMLLLIDTPEGGVTPAAGGFHDRFSKSSVKSAGDAWLKYVQENWEYYNRVSQ